MQSSEITIVDCYDRYKRAFETTNAGVYHHPAWLLACKHYGLQLHWLVAEQSGRAVGLLPLVRQCSALFGKRLISLPWVDEAGAIGSREAVLALQGHAEQLAGSLGEKYSVVLRQPIEPAAPEPPQNWSRDGSGKVLLRLKLASEPDRLWATLSPKVRNQVRKSEKSGLVAVRGGAELIGDFYDVYSHNMRDLGSPSHSLGFFEVLISMLGSRVRVYCATHEGRPVGAGVVIDNQNSLDIPWASSLRPCNHMCVNHCLYWAILADACSDGYEWFHFGRSSVDSGQYRFKRQWGAEESPLAWWRYSQDSELELNDNPIAVREKFGVAQRAWTNLPLWASRRLGPWVIRHAP